MERIKFSAMLKKSDTNKIHIFSQNDNYEQTNKVITHYMHLSWYQKVKDSLCKYERIMSNLFCHKSITVSENNDCEVYFIDCGQGDSFLIKSKGKYALIDLGGKTSSVKKFLDENVPNKKLDYVFITHLHKDHLADIKSVLKEYRIKNFVITKNVEYNEKKKGISKFIPTILKEIDENIKANSIELLEIGHCIKEDCHTYLLGNTKLEILAPTVNMNDLNDNSLVIKLNYGENSILFTGDIGEKGEFNLIKYLKSHRIDLSSSILKVAHHGSKTSSSLEFLKGVKPKFSIISYGEGNRSCLPDYETVERLDMFSQVLSTNRNGNIKITLPEKGKEIDVQVEREKTDMLDLFMISLNKENTNTANQI